MTSKANCEKRAFLSLFYSLDSDQRVEEKKNRKTLIEPWEKPTKHTASSILRPLERFFDLQKPISLRWSRRNEVEKEEAKKILSQIMKSWKRSQNEMINGCLMQILSAGAITLAVQYAEPGAARSIKQKNAHFPLNNPTSSDRLQYA